MADGVCLILIAAFLIVVRILPMLKDISLREPRKLSGWVGFPLGICSLSGPQGRLVICFGRWLGLYGRAGKFCCLVLEFDVSFESGD